MKCSSGTYNGKSAQTKCQHCPKGKYSIVDAAATMGPTSCVNCPVGTHTNATGMSSCDECPINFYQDKAG